MLAREDDDHVLAVDDAYVPARREQARDRPRQDMWSVFALRAGAGLTAGADPNPSDHSGEPPRARKGSDRCHVLIPGVGGPTDRIQGSIETLTDRVVRSRYRGSAVEAAVLTDQLPG
jgi:hypothetical protein